ncbi:hypothetical protein E2562_014395 [Oryza meyeriana var. granulata]|uniref:Uncharacterized protein n=1 Tax=Oryza meyeriana var. granulata TaxID=110450 RepID=A0A6G1CPP9_9ORYZ|nr:hypothetical protein E2562_014395 [Oryza meyeriana var. granulata]
MLSLLAMPRCRLDLICLTNFVVVFLIANAAATMIERSNSTPSTTPARPPRSPLGVDEEYDQAFRSKSFLDLWSHAHHHLTHTLSSFKLSSKNCTGAREDDQHADDGGTPTPDMEQSCSYTVLDDFVLEPSPELLARGSHQQRRRRRRRGHGRRVETLLLEYFDVTQEACEACSALLAAIGTARRHHLTLRRLLLRLDGGGDDADAKDALARHVRLANPLSPSSLSEFHDVHARCSPLASRLAAAQRRLRRLARALRIARGTAAAAFVGVCAAAIVAAVVLAAHALVGIGVAAAAFGASPAGAVRWWAGRAAEKVSSRHYARAGTTLDAAARGAYIVGRDLDTVSRMVRRAHDELEHGRDVARIAMRGHGERPLLQEVAREEEECEEDLRSQLAELEEHVYLCLITINRTRRLVAHEMTRGLPSTTTTTTATSED